MNPPASLWARLRTGRRRTPARPAGMPPITDPFAVVPERPPDVECRRNSRGLICLRREEPLSPLRRKVALWLRHDYSRKLELDTPGTLYYGLVDGQTPLSTIVERLVAETGRPHREVADGVIVFTKKLMTLNMLQLRVPTRTPPGNPP